MITEFITGSLVLALMLLCGLALITLLVGVLLGVPCVVFIWLRRRWAEKRREQEQRAWLDQATG